MRFLPEWWMRVAGMSLSLTHVLARFFCSAEKKNLTGPIENCYKVNDTPFKRNAPIPSKLFPANTFLI
jgi:hypothetical protein